MKRFLSLLLSVLLFSATALQAGVLLVVGATDKETALYQPGEKMLFTVRTLEDGQAVAGKNLKWTRTGDDGKTETGTAVSSATEPLVVSTSLDTPGFVRIEVVIVDEGGKAVRDAQNKPIRFEGGAGVGVEALAGVPEPADFDAFWERQKARLAEVPAKATLTEVASPDPAFVVYDVRIDCPGGKAVSGYFTKPKNAAPKSLKAHGTYHGYGVGPARITCEKDTLVLDINAHGLDNGKEPGFYKALQEGELKDYAFKNDENAKPETAYFNGMALRVLRGLEFLKSQPEWNGKDLVVSGGSQGGLQSLWAAALDRDVVRCDVSIPWCCDLGGITLGRFRGWRPDYTEGIAYYDAATMAKRITCPVTIVAGLGDATCPPSGICVLYNNLKSAASRRLEFIQGKTHMYTPPPGQKFVLQSPPAS